MSQKSNVVQKRPYYIHQIISKYSKMVFQHWMLGHSNCQKIKRANSRLRSNNFNLSLLLRKYCYQFLQAVNLAIVKAFFNISNKLSTGLDRHPHQPESHPSSPQSISRQGPHLSWKQQVGWGTRLVTVSESLTRLGNQWLGMGLLKIHAVDSDLG